MYLAPQMRLAALGQQGQSSLYQGQTLLPRQKRDRSLDFKNVTPERMQKAEEERRKYLERNNGVDKHNLADDVYNFMSRQPGDMGYATTGPVRPDFSQANPNPISQFQGPTQNQGPPKPPQEIIPQSNDYLAGIRAENKTRQDKINSGELVRDPNQRDRGPPRYITKAEADALRPISVTGELTPPTPTPLLKESPMVGDQTLPPPPREEPVFGGQTGGGIGGLQQFMQIMQMIMQMVQQSQGMGMGGMGMGMGMGGMRRNNFAPPQRFGGFNQYQSQQQYRPQFQQNFNNPYGPY